MNFVKSNCYYGHRIIYGKQFVVFVFPLYRQKRFADVKQTLLSGDFYKFATTYMILSLQKLNLGLQKIKGWK